MDNKERKALTVNSEMINTNAQIIEDVCEVEPQQAHDVISQIIDIFGISVKKIDENISILLPLHTR